MAHARKYHIVDGQRFRAIEGMEWMFLEFIRTSHDPHPHVALVKPHDRRTRKVISVDALFDKRLFNAID